MLRTLTALLPNLDDATLVPLSELAAALPLGDVLGDERRLLRPPVASAAAAAAAASVPPPNAGDAGCSFGS